MPAIRHLARFLFFARDSAAMRALNFSNFKRSWVSLVASIFTASKPALRPLPIATVATGTPVGICMIERSESNPLSAFDSIGTPTTGKGV